MTEPTIRDEWVEAGARALYGNGWDQADHPMRQHHRSAAHDVLAAVADDIRAEALRDAADWLAQMDDGRTGGYREAGRHIIARLRDRADQLAGESDE